MNLLERFRQCCSRRSEWASPCYSPSASGNPLHAQHTNRWLCSHCTICNNCATWLCPYFSLHIATLITTLVVKVNINIGSDTRSDSRISQKGDRTGLDLHLWYQYNTQQLIRSRTRPGPTETPIFACLGSEICNKKYQDTSSSDVSDSNSILSLFSS